MKSLIPDWLPKLFVKAEGSVREATTKKFSDFNKITDTEGMEVVGIKGGANVRADFPVGGETGEVTTSMVGLEPDDPLRNARGQFMPTKELPELENQKDANRFIASEIQRLEQEIDGIEGGDVDLSEYATIEYVDETELNVLNAAIKVATDGDKVLQDQIDAIDVPDGVDLTGYAKEEWVTEQIDAIELPVGTIVSEDPPENPEEGLCWYDTGRLELFVYANDGWFPCSPLGARVEEGEVVQAQILQRLDTGESRQETIAAEIVHALGEQSAIEGRVKVGEGVQQEIKSDLVTLENKVKQIEGAVGEHTLNFTQSNQTPRHGEFNLLDDTMQMVYKIEEAAHIQISNVDADGSPVDIDRVGVGDVIRLAHGAMGMAELRVTSESQGFFSFTKINGDLNEMFVGPYGFVMLSQYDPAGVATVAYVDQQDEVLRQDTLTLNDYFERVTIKTEGANQLPDDTDWKVRQHNSEGKNKTLIHSVGGQLGVYNLKEPNESHHAATKGYVDSNSYNGVPSRPPGLKFMCSIVNLPNGYFQWWVKESTGNQHLELATTDGDGIAWGTNTPREDVRYSDNIPFTIWEVSGGGWKMKVTGTISRIDFHPDHALCYVSNKTALNGGNFANGSGPYYITIGGII
jgi:hypothetical protein